jgi:GntR family transcriptional regulator
MDDGGSVRSPADRKIAGRSGSRSVAVRVSDEVRRRIDEGVTRPGQQLPPELLLSSELGVSRGSVREAFKLLEQEGLIEVRHGLGRFVSGNAAIKVERPVTRFESVTEMLIGRGYLPRNTVLSVEEGRPTEAEAGELQLRDGARVVRLRRARSHGEQILILSDNTFSSELLAGAPLAAAAFTGSLTDWMEEHGHRPTWSTARIECRYLPDDLRAVAGTAAGAPWLLITETCRDREGRPVLVAREYYRGDIFSFEVARLSR